MYFCLWNLESWALECGIQPKWNNPDPTKDWDPKSKPVNWEMNPEYSTWIAQSPCWSRIQDYLTLDFLTWGDNLVPRFHSVLRWKVRSSFPELGQTFVWLCDGHKTHYACVWTNYALNDALPDGSSGYARWTTRGLPKFVQTDNVSLV